MMEYPYTLDRVIALQEDKISGVTQLYNTVEDITQCISCQVVCFDTYKFAGNGTPSTVLCVASRDVQNHGKVSHLKIFGILKIFRV